MGSDTFSLPVLDRLLTSGREQRIPVEVVAVVTQPDRAVGRGRTLTSNPVKDRARRAGVPVLQPERLRDTAAIEQVLAAQPDIVVVASYGQILPRVLLETPEHWALNLHPSLLPRYRGSAPIMAPILAGERVTGSTLMLMAAKMDSGPIISQIKTPIGAEETGGELRARLADLSAGLLERDLPGWLDGTLMAVPQDETQATYTSRIERPDAELDWTLPAETLTRRIRAFAPRPGAFTIWNGQPVRILRARAIEGIAPAGYVMDEREGGMTVGTGEGILLVETLQLPGGRPLPAGAALRGHPALLDARFGESS
ncbi:MAG: methionyl-tRNA formyltransferase [Chloroflexota bacterium]|nr:methionyl-tRNA formyltransferase [Chloroflexota bacterium]